MKQGWEIKRLDEVCEFGNGLWTGKKPPFQKVGVIRNTNFTKSGELDDTDIVYLDVEQSQFAKRKLLYGDIILEKSGGGPKQPVGRVIVFDKKEGDFSFSNFTSVIRIISQDRVDFKYLHRFLFFLYISGKTEEMQSHSTGIRNLKFDDYKAIEISIPPLSEQQRIVSILDEAFAAIAVAKDNAEQNLQNAKELFESYLQGVFIGKLRGSKSKSLDELCELIVDCEHKTAPIQETGYPSIRTPNIGKGVLILDGVNRVSEETYIKWTRRAIPQANDLILAREAPAGNIAVIPENVKVCLGQRTVLIRPKKNLIISNFLAYLILSKDVQQQLLSHSTGATVEHVNMKDIRAFKIYNLPTITEQQTIVQKLDALSTETKRLEAIYQQKILDLEDLKKSVLQKAFNGELTSLGSAETAILTMPLPLQKVERISTTDLQAGITAIALIEHVQKDRLHTLHHVKAEKIVHLSEYILNVDLERNPVKDAAGPNDFPHAKKVESRAQKAGFYKVVKNGDYYDYQQGHSINNIIQKTKNCLGEKTNILINLLNLLIPMSTQQAKIVATVYAAWNNLILVGNEFSTEDIVTEARENWHKKKEDIPREKFFNAINWMKKYEFLIPIGNGKLVKTKSL